VSPASKGVEASRHRPGWVIGVDGANLRQGGGITHLVELLGAAEPEEHGVSRVVVWGGAELMAALPDRPWLTKVRPPALARGLLRRQLWQRFQLSGAAHRFGCDVLFVPASNYSGTFRPVVAMSRNLLPFETGELRRFGWSLTTLRLLALRWAQSRTYRSADGMVFLTRYARERVLATTGPIAGEDRIIPHGTSGRFRSEPRPQRSIEAYDPANPFRILYVSTINHYKHQWNVVDAVASVRTERGWPLALDLVGPAHPPALARLKRAMDRVDPQGVWVRYHGKVPYSELHDRYAMADLGIFASTCENMPNILLETMAAGLPIACSHHGPMPEVLGNAGVYFDPEQPQDIGRALRELIDAPELRSGLARKSHEAARRFSWERCATDTFDFLAGLARTYAGDGR
jgi:glycosyltransferase involved in cell wall biosynthesis